MVNAQVVDNQRCRAVTALLSALFTLRHTGMLGAFLTFGQFRFYNDACDLQDQQLAGLIMWLPGGLAYLIAGGWCGWRLFAGSTVLSGSSAESLGNRAIAK
jgi:putative membrane protein